MKNSEFETILLDLTKRIDGNISWQNAQQEGAQEFRVPIFSDSEYPITMVGRYSQPTGKLTYAIIHQREGRIYALDLGAIHRNPLESDRKRQLLRGTHKHYWTEEHRDRWAYVPPDITQPWNHPLEVWQEFCSEARIRHSGTLHPPVGFQRDLL